MHYYYNNNKNNNQNAFTIKIRRLRLLLIEKLNVIINKNDTIVNVMSKKK